MTAEQYDKTVCTILEWGCGLRAGAPVLARCVAAALQHQEWGEAWTPMGVAQEVAIQMGKQQHAAWMSMDIMLRHCRCPRSVAKAIKELVAEASQ